MSRPVLVPAPPPPADRSPAAPLFCWLAIQLLALSLGVLRVPLSARFPLPGEQFALHVMLVTQIVASAMLFPFLLRDFKTSVMAILAIAPFVQLAGYLSSTPAARAALSGVYVVTWLATLATWSSILRTRRATMLGVAAVIGWSVGLAITWYVLAESRIPPSLDWATDGLFGPILGAVSQVEGASIVTSPWVAAWTALLICASTAAAVHAARKRAVGRSGNSPTAS